MQTFNLSRTGKEGSQVKIRIGRDSEAYLRYRRKRLNNRKALNQPCKGKTKNKHRSLTCPKFKVLFESQELENQESRLAQVQTLVRAHCRLRLQFRDKKRMFQERLSVAAAKRHKPKGILLRKEPSQFMKHSPLKDPLFPKSGLQPRKIRGIPRLPSLALDPEKGVVVGGKKSSQPLGGFSNPIGSPMGVAQVESSPLTPGLMMPLTVASPTNSIGGSSFGGTSLGESEFAGVDEKLPAVDSFIRMLEE
uniref:Uncharacterized protein n=1 Tax=Lotharella globosa TaxID=91324 RepID=A0A7S4DK57_9EUKA